MQRLYVFGIILAGIAIGALSVYLMTHREGLSYTVPGPLTGTLVTSPASTTSTSAATSTPQKTVFTYAEVTGSCGPYYQGTCVNLRSSPSTSSPVVMKLRDGMVFQVVGSVPIHGTLWYQVSPGTNLRYPERVTSDWFVYADGVRIFTDDGDHRINGKTVTKTNKRIVVDRSEQMLYAYEGTELFMKEPVSTGLELSPTPRGTFTVYAMTPSRYMQGPLPDVSDQYYDMPGVPWNLYFTKEGAVVHGAYWHNNFGTKWSHGCVNLPPQKAKELYEWAELGMTVTVRD